MAASRETATSTIPPWDSGVSGWEGGLRKTSVAFITSLLVLGLVGGLGVRMSEAHASSEGLSMSVRHAVVTRGGLATPFGIGVHTEDGSRLPATLTIRVDAPYLAMFDEHGLSPDPSSSYQTDQWTWWTFDIPEGASSFQLSLDARLEPSVQWGEQATAAVEVEGREKVAVDFATWVIP